VLVQELTHAKQVAADSGRSWGCSTKVVELEMQMAPRGAGSPNGGDHCLRRVTVARPFGRFQQRRGVTMQNDAERGVVGESGDPDMLFADELPRSTMQPG
jgi:hypothetical protein